MKGSKFWWRLLAVSAVVFFLTILIGNVALMLGGDVPLINGIVESLFVIYGVVALISVIMAIIMTIRAIRAAYAKTGVLKEQSGIPAGANSRAGAPAKAGNRAKAQDEITNPADQYSHAISFANEQDKMKWLAKSAEQGYKPALDMLYGMLKDLINKAPEDGFDSGFGNDEDDALCANEWIFDPLYPTMHYINKCKHANKDKRYDAIKREFYALERKAFDALRRVESYGDHSDDGYSDTDRSTADIDTIGPGNPWF